MKEAAKASAKQREAERDNSVGFYIKITKDLRDRIERARVANYQDNPTDAPTTKKFVTDLIDQALARQEKRAAKKEQS